MRKIIMFFMTLILCYTIMTYSINAEELQMYKMRATAYCLNGKTYTGKEVRKGLCATSNKEWLGKTAILYKRLPNNDIGEIVGIYEITDTGCKDYVVDVWMPEDECQTFMNKVYKDDCGGKVWVQILEARG